MAVNEDMYDAVSVHAWVEFGDDCAKAHLELGQLTRSIFYCVQ